MLKVDQYSYIRTAHRVYGKKIKQIARETGHSKNTIKRVLRGEYSGYTPRTAQPYPVLSPYLELIEQWLKADKQRPKKQRHTAVRRRFGFIIDSDRSMLFKELRPPSGDMFVKPS